MRLAWRWMVWVYCEARVGYWQTIAEAQRRRLGFVYWDATNALCKAHTAAAKAEQRLVELF